MRAAAADLDFEEAARLRDEIKRLRSTELAVTDDPTAKFLPSPGGGGSASGARRGGMRGQASGKVHKPALDEMGIALHHEVAPHREGKKVPRKPGLDEMGPGVEAVPRKEAGSAGGATGTQKSSSPRSTLGRPGMHGGWKPRRR
jgi:excinuclease ABC subunit B